MFKILNIPAFAQYIAHALGLSFGTDGSAGHIIENPDAAQFPEYPLYYVQVMCFEMLNWGCSAAGNGLLS